METQDEAYDQESMGRQLKKLRRSIHLSQEKFAERMNMSKDTIYNYEKGKTAISHDLVKKLCQEFNVSADFFYFEMEKPLVEDEKRRAEAFTEEWKQCSNLEKEQLMEMLRILRMNPEGTSICQIME